MSYIYYVLHISLCYSYTIKLLLVSHDCHGSYDIETTTAAANAHDGDDDDDEEEEEDEHHDNEEHVMMLMLCKGCTSCRNTCRMSSYHII